MVANGVDLDNILGRLLNCLLPEKSVLIVDVFEGVTNTMISRNSCMPKDGWNR
jgi:hypothetical protein